MVEGECQSRGGEKCFIDLCEFTPLLPVLGSGLPGMPGEYVPQSGPMGMSMALHTYTNAHQMTSSPSQLRHGPPLYAYLPDRPRAHHPHHHPHHHAMLMHGGPSSHPGMAMSAQRAPLLNPIDPSAGGQGLDIHAQ